MQVKTYPLPPLFLSEVIERAKADHTHQCDDYCLDTDGGKYGGAALCRESREENNGLLDEPVVVRIDEGYGRHQCDGDCKPQATANGRRCLSHCEDSDWVVEVCYHANGWHAIYGVKRHGDVQNVSLWAD